MQAGSGRIWEHIQYIIFWLAGFILRFKCFVLFPEFLPFMFYLPEIVSHKLNASKGLVKLTVLQNCCEINKSSEVTGSYFHSNSYFIAHL